MATLRINLALLLEGGTFELDRLTIPELQVTTAGQIDRRTVTIPAGEAITLDPGTIAPLFFVFYLPPTATKHVRLDWGPGGSATLKPGYPALVPTDQIPTATGLETNGDPASTDIDLTYAVIST